MVDYLIVGAGIFGAVMAQELTRKGKSVLVLEKENRVAGHIYTERREGIDVHVFGAHIFHTPEKEIWEYVNRFADFNHYVNSPIANYKGELYNLPFNMHTFHQMWGVQTPEKAKQIIEEQRREITGEPKNLEEQAISLVGRDIYEKLIKGYTEKQWGRACDALPAFIIKRLPVRFRYDNNYFNDPFQGIPKEGYTAMIENMLDGVQVVLETDYLKDKKRFDTCAKKVIYSGPIDAYFDYCLGPLEYRTLRFESEVLDMENYQGVAVMNYTDRETPYTRVLEHKHFNFGTQEKTIITREYPAEWKLGDDPYYPINNEKNQNLYLRYKEMAKGEKHVIFGGRLAEYKYYDMWQVVQKALLYANLLGG